MKEITDTISINELRKLSERMYESIVKADVDVEKGIMIVDMDMHADGEAALLEKGSKQEDLWGVNLHPDKYGMDEFIEFDSMINIKPRQKNPSRDVLDESVRNKIKGIINGKVSG